MKLEIESVEFKNFLTFGSRVQKVPFLKGLNLVTGIDIDRKRSNASGKSSFLETVPFALFGQVHRNINKKQIVNWKNRKKCEVVLNFSIGDDSYKVLRAIKPDNFEIYKNTTLIDKPSHVREYQAILEQIIGLSFQTFMSLIHSNINSSAKILTMSKPEKRKLIDMMFGLTIYKKIQERSNSRLREIVEKVREIEITNSSNTDRIGDLQSTIDELEFKASAKPIQYTQLREKEEELKEIKEEYEGIKDELESKRSELNEKESEIKYAESMMNNVNNSLYKIKVKLKNVDDGIKKCNEYERITHDNEHNKQKLNDLEDIYGNIGEIESKLSNVRNEISDIEKDLNDTENSCNILERDISRFIQEIAESTFKIKKLEDNVCPTCYQKISDTSILEKEQRNLTSFELKEKEAYGKKEKLTNRYTNTKFDLPNLIEFKEELEVIKNDIVNITKKIIDMVLPYKKEDLVKDKIRYDKTINKLETLFYKYESDIKETSKDTSLLSERVDDLQKVITNAYTLESDIERLKEFIELEKQNQKELKSLIESNKKKIKSLKEKTSTSSEKSNTLTNLKDYMLCMKDVCKDENIKQYAISSVMPYINERANHYLSEVNYSFYVVLDKWLEMQVKGPGITKASYGSLSGGESRGIDIAIQLAFLDISKLRASIFPDFLTLDELLDSSIDSGGISQLFKIISLKQKEDNSKTFIISHRSELDEMSDVDNVYHVTKKGGYSTVEII